MRTNFVTMTATEVSSFVTKFSDLLHDGHKASLVMDCDNGAARVSLEVFLELDRHQHHRRADLQARHRHPPQHERHPPHLPGDTAADHLHQCTPGRAGPSRLRRRARRQAAARQAQQHRRAGHHPPQDRRAGHHPPPDRRAGHHPPPDRRAGHHPPQDRRAGHHPPPDRRAGHPPPPPDKHAGHHPLHADRRAGHNPPPAEERTCHPPPPPTERRTCHPPPPPAERRTCHPPPTPAERRSCHPPPPAETSAGQYPLPTDSRVDYPSPPPAGHNYPHPIVTVPPAPPAPPRHDEGCPVPQLPAPGAEGSPQPNLHSHQELSSFSFHSSSVPSPPIRHPHSRRAYLLGDKYTRPSSRTLMKPLMRWRPDRNNVERACSRKAAAGYRLGIMGIPWELCKNIYDETYEDDCQPVIQFRLPSELVEYLQLQRYLDYLD